MSGFNSKKLHGQTIKGRVAEINPHLLYFNLDETEKKTLRVYIDITKALPEFPCMDTKIEIVNPKKFNSKTNTAIIGPETTCNFPNILAIHDAESLEIFYLLRDNNVDDDGLFAIDNFLKQLEPFVPRHILPKCLKYLFYCTPLITTDLRNEYKESFKNIKLKLPSDLNYVNSNSELYSFLKFDGMCWYNVYPSRSVQKVTDSCSEYLFGVLDVDSLTGHFSLSDNTSKMLVKFYTTTKDLYNFKGSLVMFKKWAVFTEIFQDKLALSLKYILAYVEDVLVIESLVNRSEERLFYRKDEVLDTEQRKSILLQTLKISEIIYGDTGPECWIEALILEKDTSSKQLVYVVLTENHITIVPFLKEHVVYRIFYKDKPKFLKTDFYKELNRIKRTKDILYTIGKDAIFQESEITLSPQNDVLLESFHDVEKFIKTASPSQPFSFCLKIAKKELQDISNFPSYISKRHENVPYFGTQGKNIQMRLIFMNAGTYSFIDLYMADRDNVVTPLGLVDDMVVKVKNVHVLKKKYVKTNVFSCIEIVNYCPELTFSSVNMFFSDRSTWHWKKQTPIVPLGMFPHLPQRCIVHGAFIFRAISDLKITPVCVRCKQPSVPAKQCRGCDIADRDLVIEMGINAYDFISSSFYMHTDNKNFFFEVIGLRNRHEIKTFSDSFYKIPVIKVNFCKFEEFQICIRDPESKALVDQIIEFIRSHISFNLLHLVEAVCMKQPGEKQWKIIDFIPMC